MTRESLVEILRAHVHGDAKDSVFRFTDEEDVTLYLGRLGGGVSVAGVKSVDARDAYVHATTAKDESYYVPYEEVRGLLFVDRSGKRRTGFM